MKKLGTILCLTSLGLISTAVYGQDMTVHAIEKNSVIVGGKVGSLRTENQVPAVMTLGAMAEYAAAKNFLIGFGMDYWRNSFDLEGERVDLRTLTASLQGKVALPLQYVSPFVSAGLAEHQLVLNRSASKDEASELDPVADKKTNTEYQFGIDLGAGLLYNLSQKLDMMLEFKHRNILEESVEYDQIAMSAGVNYFM